MRQTSIESSKETPKLILASSSPFRRELLARLQIPFESIAPDIDETPEPGETPQQLVERLALEKARAIADQYPRAVVIGSDQVAMHGDNIVGKPGSHEEAVNQLHEASGRAVTLYTGLALVRQQPEFSLHELVPFTVVFRELTDQQIENYLGKDQPYNCAGSVKSESLGVALFERFEGDDPNALIGLPLIRLVRMLEKAGIAVI